ncbi:hypothetical protein E6W39_06545 [Kitasatospora acidiphila]|uniref:Uncharacterized protein n=1 Tax=Kitasatospora acidiphila TaxID=2567942 RepID=A0A540VZ00_9ACTN|nr:hypothetical protein [Kitasatospora acidiphila]TQF01996.1 hypothetical protein E6W39_06545 [Kitasatospora acidiphila]
MTDVLSDREETLVQAAIGALEIADGIVPGEAFPALADDALRAVVAHRLEAAGRVLLAREHRTVAGYISGYDDDVALRLASEGIGVLPEADRAVLAIALLRTVAIPRAGGQHRSTSWFSDGPGTSVAEIHANTDNYFTYDHVRFAVRRLKARRLLRTGYRGQLLPGPALLRLTEAQSTRLWEDLILVTLPHSLWADIIRGRREQAPRPSPVAPSLEERES